VSLTHAEKSALLLCARLVEKAAQGKGLSTSLLFDADEAGIQDSTEGFAAQESSSALFHRISDKWIDSIEDRYLNLLKDQLLWYEDSPAGFEEEVDSDLRSFLKKGLEFAKAEEACELMREFRNELPYAEGGENPVCPSFIEKAEEAYKAGDVKSLDSLLGVLACRDVSVYGYSEPRQGCSFASMIHDMSGVDDDQPAYLGDGVWVTSDGRYNYD